MHIQIDSLPHEVPKRRASREGGDGSPLPSVVRSSVDSPAIRAAASLGNEEVLAITPREGNPSTKGRTLN